MWRRGYVLSGDRRAGDGMEGPLDRGRPLWVAQRDFWLTSASQARLGAINAQIPTRSRLKKVWRDAGCKGAGNSSGNRPIHVSVGGRVARSRYAGPADEPVFRRSKLSASSLAIAPRYLPLRDLTSSGNPSIYLPTMSVTLLMLAVGCWLLLETMSRTELDRIKDRAEVLRTSG